MIKSDSQLNTLTGIDSFEMLNAIVEATSTIHAPWLKGIHFALKDLVILTMAKLKLNISYRFMSILFNCSERSTSSYFKQTLKLLKSVLGVAIAWPSRQEIKKNLPKQFENCKDTRIILDCSEVQIETPKCLHCRLLTYSHYKSAHTLKFLLGVTCRLHYFFKKGIWWSSF